MKKLLFTILLVFISVTSVSAFDNTQKVYDYAQVLTSSEEESLKNAIDNYISKYNMDMVLVTVKYHQKSTTKEYAQDFYDYNNFGVNSTNDGIIFVIDFTFGYTDIYIATTGNAIRMYDDTRIDKMLDNIADKKDKGYCAMFEKFINDADSYASKGVPSSNQNAYISPNGDITLVDKYATLKIVLVCVIVSLIVASIVIGILVARNKMVLKKIEAEFYLNKDTVKILNKKDRFVTTHTTSVRINDSSSSSRIGGSSVSRGSSGVMHGGGGRRL